MNPSFVKNILTILTGNTIAFAIPVMLYPFLSRIFVSEDYALFGLYFSALSLLEIASVGRYDSAIVLPEKDDDAINLIAGGLLISTLYSILIFLLVVLLKDFVSLKLNNPSLANWLFLLPLSLFLLSVNKLCNCWLIRIKKFKASSINKASQKIAEGSSQLALGFLNAGNGLILGDLTGKFLNAIFSMYQSIKSGLDKKRIHKIQIIKNLKQYSHFPKFAILPSMLNALGGMLPVFIISSYYPVEVSGNFNFSRIILSVPFALIANGISQVLMQRISEKKIKSESISRELLQLAFRLSILSLAGLIVLFISGPDIFEFIFGAKWRLSGEYTTILIFSYCVSFIVSPFSVLLIVLERIKVASLWQTFYFILISILWFLNDVSINDFLVVLVIIDLISYVIYGLLIHKAVKDYEYTLGPRII